MSCACPAHPSGTPALATSFGSIGTLRPADPDSFVEIGVLITPEGLSSRVELVGQKYRERAGHFRVGITRKFASGVGEIPDGHRWD